MRVLGRGCSRALRGVGAFAVRMALDSVLRAVVQTSCSRTKGDGLMSASEVPQTLATPANMRRVEAEHPNRRAVAYSPFTGETYSATPGDYWDRPDNKPLTDSAGEPMALVFEFTGVLDALTGEPLR